MANEVLSSVACICIGFSSTVQGKAASAEVLSAHLFIILDKISRYWLHFQGQFYVAGRGGPKTKKNWGVQTQAHTHTH